MEQRLYSVFLFGLISLISVSSQGDVVTLQDGLSGYSGTADAYLYRFHPDRNYGTSSELRVKPAPESVMVDSLVRFAVFSSEGGPVPDDATIESAVLSVYKFSTRAHEFGPQAVLKDWQETAVSWSESSPGIAWDGEGPSAIGSDVATAVDGSVAVDSAAQWVNMDVTQSLQVMAAGQANYGWKLSSVSGPSYVYKFHSRESGDPGLRPKLTVTYSGGTGGGNQPPSVSLTSPADGSSVVNGNDIVLVADASDADGSVVSMEFYNGSALLGTVNTPPFRYIWSTPAVGSYSLMAVATDDLGASTVSATVNVSVLDDNVAPTVSIVSPLDGDQFGVSTNIQIDVNAEDSDGAVALVELFANGSLIGESTNAPHVFHWPSATIGDHILTVRAVDDDGAESVSQAISISVVNDGSSGFDMRPANASCVAPDRPVAASTVEFVEVFDGLGLNASNWGNSIAMVQPPNDPSTWYLVDRTGRIASFDNVDTVSGFTVALDIRDRIVKTGNLGLNGMAFHPNYPTDRRAFIFYVTDNPDYPEVTTKFRWVSRVSSFEMSSDNVHFDIASEQVLLQIPINGSAHPGGGIQFGPDGYLYIATGDDISGSANGQSTSTLKGKVIRIDVDSQSPYAIPPGNPFASGGDGLPELFAWGFRHPWRWSIDQQTGDLWLGDVGGKDWEEVNLVTAGGNYGWAYREGFECRDNATPEECTSSTFTDPVYVYSHNGGSAAIAGGQVYRGSLFPEIYGHFIFGDIVQGIVWALSFDLQGEPVVQELWSGVGFRSYSVDGNNEIYGIKQRQIYRMVRTVGDPEPEIFPQSLIDTGCFDPADLSKPAAGVIPYEINVPFWSNGADKERWFAIPDGTTIHINSKDDFEFPIGTVAIKNFRIDGELEETRLFVRHDDGGWAGYSYEWNADHSNAFLVAAEGKSKMFGSLPYDYPSRNECLQCHTEAAGNTLGPEVAQLNRQVFYTDTGITANQLKTYAAIGLLDAPLASEPELLAFLAPTDDLSYSLHDRARSYLHSNCSSCHRDNGNAGGTARFDYRVADADMDICNVVPSQGDLGVPGAMVLLPGEPGLSILSLRMARLGEDAMPPIGKTALDIDGMQLIDEWIESLPACP